MRRVRYQVACSLDGYIAGPKGEIDWIAGGDDFDFEDLFSQFDTLVMGRKTFDQLPGGAAGYPGKQIIVVSRTMKPEDHPGVEIVGSDVAARIRELRGKPGRDIWLFGGGELFRSLLEAKEVDGIEPAVIPVILGGGVPMYPAGFDRAKLSLRRHREYAGGMILLEYDVVR